MQIRKNQIIKGLKIKQEEYKVQAFADDLVFIMEDPLETGTLMHEVEEFGKVAGLKINKEKTKLLMKNCTKRQGEELERKLGIQIAKKVK